MCEVAEKHAAVRVIPHVLDNGSAKRVAVRFAQLLRRGVRKTLEQHTLDAGIPSDIDERFVRKNGVGGSWQRPGGRYNRCPQKQTDLPYPGLHWLPRRPVARIDE